MHQKHDPDDDAHEGGRDRQHGFIKPRETWKKQLRFACRHRLLPPICNPCVADRRRFKTIIAPDGSGSSRASAAPGVIRTRLCCTACRLLALLGPREMSDLSPQSETKRT